MYQYICSLSRTSKKLLVLGCDGIAIILAITISIILRHSDLWPAGDLWNALPFYQLMLVGGLALAITMGIPQVKLSTFDLHSAAKIGLFALSLSIIATAVNIVIYLGVSRTVPMIFGMVMFSLSVGWKLAALAVLDWMRAREHPQSQVAVYGAGPHGIQLVNALEQSIDYRITTVIDDNPSLHGVVICGHRVQSRAALDKAVKAGRVDRVLLALTDPSPDHRRDVLSHLETLPCEVQTLPAYVDIIENGGMARSLKPVSSDDLLGRDSVDLDIPEISNAYEGKSVLISGAGGSIGSELCRQVLTCSPRRIVLFERSELALYTIDQELRPLVEKAGVDLVTVLGSVCDRQRVERTFMLHEVEIVLHAAAYKHVPLVEENELEGVKNNVFGTQVLAEEAREHGVERFILISTDKAVRPTNVMGSTKRMAEMVIQDLARRTTKTRYSMVRFGNVLGSSGSVIPLFQKQISAGGPITLTHPDVTRFFMTVPEAARLVLLAGSYAQGGDVFVLDMGKPVKIYDLAQRMIELSGLTARDASNPDGDIAIKVTGLRPGEKLYEELLIDDDSLLGTPHPKILRAEEYCPSQIEIASILQALRTAAETDSPSMARRQIEAWVEGYHRTETPSPHVAAE